MRTLLFLISLLTACTPGPVENRNREGFSTSCDDALEIEKDYMACAEHDYLCARQVRYARKTLEDC